MVDIVVEYGHCVCPISLHLWNVYLIPLELAGLECDSHHVNFRFPFSNYTQKQFIVPILFPRKNFQGMHYRGSGVYSLID